ncbi:MAG: prolyl oligopeptidase family serine peptidase, partial [Gordonia sp. (in: high G+C Gram-positive bacteria)]|uniref:alpha/beta hydrolase family protein n=1 Tax=Gordonia sp. (in: high G+C Gram-positive bacteria) TaxID=84139 RepID=UPI003BB60000
EYRRVDLDGGGRSGGGWPQTGRDVLAALAALDGPVAEQLGLAGIAVDRRDVAVVGHSAGGQLAVWAVAHLGARTQRHRITTVVPQSAVLDFTVPDVRDKASVVALLGATYAEAPQRYRDASPAHGPISDALIAVVHTTQDQSVPVERSRQYVQTMAERGQRVTLTEVPGDHAAFLDLRSAAHRQTLRTLGR